MLWTLKSSHHLLFCSHATNSDLLINFTYKLSAALQYVPATTNNSSFGFTPTNTVPNNAEELT